MNKTGLLRNLEQIQEDEPGARGVRPGTLLLTSLGAACVVFAMLSRARQKAVPAALTPDPLSDLVAQAAHPASLELAGKDVTFPAMLSDAPHATTALAAVRPSAAPGAAAANAAPAILADVNGRPPPATDRLPTMALPARNVLSSTPQAARPHDVLAQMAKQALASSAPLVEEGRAGGYQLQASSFRDEDEANQFATVLRQHGHHAYVEAAQLNGRGTWYRVRVGPFKSQREALSYRAEFEKRERLAPFLVEPPKEKLASKVQ